MLFFDVIGSFVLLLDDDVTTAVDIYSFGMCALEVRVAPPAEASALTPANYEHVC